jgi:hypothetical protein
MEKKLRYVSLAFLPFMVLVLAAGCGGTVGSISPKKDATEVAFLPTFSWKVKNPINDLTFELYRAGEFDVKTKQAAAKPILKVTKLDAAQQQQIALSDLATLKTKYGAEGDFLKPGHDMLEPSKDYVWVVRGTSANKPFVEAFKFRTRKEYYRQD